jgi:hypothetical protein
MRAFPLCSPALAFAMLLATAPVASSQQSCDPNLASRAIGPFGYKQRGNRCEGIYSRQVSTTVLYLVSLTSAFGDFDVKSGTPLVVSWPAGTGDTIRVRAESIRDDLYYRMDAAVPGDKAFDWPTDVLSAQRMARRDLGIVATTKRSFGTSPKDTTSKDTTWKEVYVPLAISQGGKPAPCGPVRVLLWPGVALDSVTVSVAAISPKGTVGEPIGKDRELGLGFYPARRIIDAKLPALKPAMYSVRFVSYPRRSTPTPISYLITVPPVADTCATAR